MDVQIDNAAGRRSRLAQRGLTLLELLVTLAIVALLASVGVPGFNNFTANQNRLSGTNELSFSLMLARSEAVKRAQFVTVCRSADQTSCAGAGDDWGEGWIVFANTSSANASTREADDEPILYSFTGIGSNVDFATGDLANGFVSFRPSGDLGVDATWTWCDYRGADQARSVVVDQAGRARVSDAKADGGALECT